MGIEISGKLHAIFDTNQVTERFRKREFVIELADNPRYPQFVMFQLSGDRCENLDGFDLGDEVRIEFSLRGREWQSPQGETKYFNSLDVWTIERAGGGDGPRGDEPPLPEGPPPGFDDVPF
jgi:hypothetical protein